MTETDTSGDSQDLRPNYDNPEVAQAIQAQHYQEEQEQEKKLSEAELTKRKIMRERGEVDPDAPPVHIEFDGYNFEFEAMPKKIRVWVENTGLDFVGFDEDDIESNDEQAATMRSVKARTIEILTKHSDAALDEEFWSDWFGVEERMDIIITVTDRQEERAGNRR